MKMTSTKYKHKRALLNLSIALFMMLALVGGFGSSKVFAACAGQTVKISNGTRCTFDGTVACDKGYSAQYVGSTLGCLKTGTTQATPVQGPATVANGYQCGGGKDASGNANPHVTTSIILGCRGEGNPIMDLTFGIIRFLSTGVGLVLVGSMIVAGIQYTSSRGDPNATAQAENRIRSNVVALLIFIFAYAMVNYVVPGAFLK